MQTQSTPQVNAQQQAAAQAAFSNNNNNSKVHKQIYNLVLPKTTHRYMLVTWHLL